MKIENSIKERAVNVCEGSSSALIPAVVRIKSKEQGERLLFTTDTQVADI